MYGAQRYIASHILSSRNQEKEAWGSAKENMWGEIWVQLRTGKEETTLSWVSVLEPGVFLNLNNKSL